jgi:hypothetical protein
MRSNLARYVTVSVPVILLLLAVATGLTSAVYAAERLSNKELKALVASAKSPEDHLKLARHYRAVAEEHEAAAAEHEALADEYAKHPPRGPAAKQHLGPKSAAHCKYFAEHCRKAAEQMRELAAAHEEMAGKGK